MWAIIGGSGFENFDQVEKVADLDLQTPFGKASSGFKKISIGGESCLFLSRHGAHHELGPSEVNYRANVFALKKHGAKGILSVSAVGSLQPDLKPGDLVVPSQYIDRTKSLRKTSFAGEGVVAHVSLAKPVLPELINLMTDIQVDFPVHLKKTYVCIEGPYFSTQAESNTYRAMGADIIGMTNFPEYALAREAGLAYLPLSFVTDFDCWDESIPHVTLSEVIQIMKANNKKAFQVITQILKNTVVASAVATEGSDEAKANAIADTKAEAKTVGESFWQGLKLSEMSIGAGLMTPIDSIDAEKRKWLDVLMV